MNDNHDDWSEVDKLVALGLTAKEIEANTGLPLDKIKNHIKELVRQARRHGLAAGIKDW